MKEQTTIKINPIELAKELDNLSINDGHQKALIMTAASVIRELIKNLQQQISENRKLNSIVVNNTNTQVIKKTNDPIQ
jgi:hypothetical protein